MKNKKCVMMCEPINVSRPYCVLYSVYLNEIQDYIGPYQIVDVQSLGMPYKQIIWSDLLLSIRGLRLIIGLIKNTYGVDAITQ